jgi:hypothetical protein
MQIQRSAINFAAALTVVFMAAGCGGAGPSFEDADAPSFTGPALESVASRSGALHVALRSSPKTPAIGADAFELSVTDDLGQPAAGFVAEVVPWMPAHGHGTSVQPVVRAQGQGVFVATPVYLYMPGRWELRIALAGAIEDAATATFDIP